ncbi:DGQHR domain-containing protein [Oscillibacter hominis]|uniref:DGQHR domain-containing protein n=1 Tax=Oscillibacter hominis TaxID=2763056 RepID=A0A7G9B6H7_9FIRM|nr:DGQHR domain-containing protein [Oscillibacter hominis]QNL45158.1 DGQHR domain-containing protein [Oscillibacter hominis]
MKTKRTKKKLTAEQKAAQLKKHKELAFRKKIHSSFTEAGFTYFSTLGKHFSIGTRIVELDYLFLHENIIVICEDNTKQKKDINHIRNKNESFAEIRSNKTAFLSWLASTFPEKAAMVKQYLPERYFLYYIYISQTELEITEEEKKRYSNLLFWDTETLSFFNRMAQCIQHSARYEIFRYLGLKNDEIGFSGSEGGKTTIKAPIIYPQDATGLRNGVRVVSFMMSAEKLLRTSYVLRKDSWEESMFLYQRLIEKDKVKSIRAFLAQKGEAFYNNIIVALPDNVTFEDDTGNPILVENIGDFQHCKLVLPDEMNSICVIDGQHRIFAHYEAPITEKYELQIAPLRKQLHLLVTGLIFPAEMKEAERKQIQSQIFLDINDNTKKVAPNVLTHIEMVKDPFSDIGLARRVIERLNKKRVFLNCFELSALDESKIKVASIIKFALRYLVTTTPAEEKTSLYAYWPGDKEAFQQKDETALNDYIEFCAKSIDLYFSAIRDAFKLAWNDPASKILSVISINGFIIAFNRQLNKYGVRDYPFYSGCVRKLSIDFSKDGFPYTSSQYRKFSGKILAEAFDFTDEELETT